MRFRLTPARLALLLLGIDLLLIVIYVVVAAGTGLSEYRGRWYVGATNGVASHWGYLKWLVTAAVLALVWFRERQAAYLALAAVFLILWYDDIYERHEAFASFLARHDVTQDSLLLRAQDYGELIAFALLGLLTLAILRWGYLRSLPAARRDVLEFVVLLAVLAVFGVGVDMADIAFERLGVSGPPTLVAFAVVEDGGELAIGSLTVAKAVQIWVRGRGESRQAGGHAG